MAHSTLTSAWSAGKVSWSLLLRRWGYLFLIDDPDMVGGDEECPSLTAGVDGK
jgi:hypothetical protein